MAEITKEFAHQVVDAMVAKDNSIQDIQKHLDSLDANGQKAFILDAAQKLGMNVGTTTNEKPSGMIPTIIRKYGEALTGGLSNVIEAGKRTAIGKISDLALPPTERTEPGFKKNLADVVSENEALSKENPKTSFLSTVAGYATPQGLYGRLSGGANLAERIAGGGLAAGTVKAMEELQKPNLEPSEAGKDIGSALIAGTLASGTAEAISGVIPPVMKSVGSFGKKVLASLRGIRPESMDTYLANPEAVNAVIKDLSDEKNFVPSVQQHVNEAITNFVSNKNESIDGVLKDAPNINLQPLANKASELVSSIKVSTPIEQRQLGELIKQANILKGLSTQEVPQSISFPTTSATGEMVMKSVPMEISSQPKIVTALELQNIKRSLQTQADELGAYTNTGFKETPISKAFGELAEIAKEMIEKVAPDVKPLNEDLQKGIQLQKELHISSPFSPQGGIQEKQVQQILSTFHNGAKAPLARTVKSFDSHFGTNLEGAAELYRSAKELKPGDIISEFRTGRSLLGGVLGGIEGGPVGAAVGVTAGSPVLTRPILRTGQAIGNFAQQVSSPTFSQSIARPIGMGLAQRLPKLINQTPSSPSSMVTP